MTYYERNLPHWHPEGRHIFLTWRLYGSLPAGFNYKLVRIRQTPGRQFLEADEKLDAAMTGPRWLSDPEIARRAEDAILRGMALGQYNLSSYVVMPNHIHLLLQPLQPLRRITGGIKGVSARQANICLGRTGSPFWQAETFDHWIRNQSQFDRVRQYIENNPVKARLVKRAEDWQWSSARQ